MTPINFPGRFPPLLSKVLQNAKKYMWRAWLSCALIGWLVNTRYFHLRVIGSCALLKLTSIWIINFNCGFVFTVNLVCVTHTLAGKILSAPSSIKLTSPCLRPRPYIAIITRESTDCIIVHCCILWASKFYSIGWYSQCWTIVHCSAKKERRNN